MFHGRTLSRSLHPRQRTVAALHNRVSIVYFSSTASSDAPMPSVSTKPVAKVRSSTLINEYTFRAGHGTVTTPPASEYVDWSTPLAQLSPQFDADGTKCRVIGASPTAVVASAPEPVLGVITGYMQASPAKTPDPSLPSKLSPQEIYEAASIISKRSIDPATGMYTNASPPRFAALPADYVGLAPERTRYFRHGAVEVFALPLRSDLADILLVNQLYSFRRPDVVVSDMARPHGEPLAFFTDPLAVGDRAAGAYVSPSELSDRNFLLYASAQLSPRYVAAAVAESMAVPHDRPLTKPKPKPKPTPEPALGLAPERAPNSAPETESAAAPDSVSKLVPEAPSVESAPVLTPEAATEPPAPGPDSLDSQAPSAGAHLSPSPAASDAGATNDVHAAGLSDVAASTPGATSVPTEPVAPSVIPQRRWGLAEGQTAPELLFAGRPLAVSRLNLAYRRAFDGPSAEPLSALHHAMALDLQTDAGDRPLDNCVMRFEPALCVARVLREAVYEQAALEQPRTIFVFYDHVLTTHLEMSYDVLPALSPADWTYIQRGYPAARLEASGVDITSPRAPVSAAGQALWDDAMVRARVQLGEWTERRRIIEAGGDPDAEATDEDTDGEVTEGRIDVTERTAPPTGPTSADRAAYAVEQVGRPLWQEKLTQFAVFHADAENARPWRNTTRLFASIYGPYASRTPTCGKCEQTEDSSGFYKSCCRAPVADKTPTPLENLWHWPQTTDDWSACRRPTTGLGSHGFRHRTSEAAPPSPCDFVYATTGMPVDDVRMLRHPRVRLHRAPVLAEPVDQSAPAESSLLSSVITMLRNFMFLPPAEKHAPPLESAPEADPSQNQRGQVAINWRRAISVIERFVTDTTGISTRLSNAEDILLLEDASQAGLSPALLAMLTAQRSRATRGARTVTVGSLPDGQPSALVSSMIATRVMGARTSDRTDFLFKRLPGHRQFVVSVPTGDAEVEAEIAFANKAAPPASLGFEAAGAFRSPALRMDELRFLVQCLAEAVRDDEGVSERVQSYPLDEQVLAFLSAAAGAEAAEAARRDHLQTVYNELTSHHITENTIELLLGQRLLRDAKFVMRRRLTETWEGAQSSVANTVMTFFNIVSDVGRFLNTWFGSPRLNKDEKKQPPNMSDKSKKTI